VEHVEEKKDNTEEMEQVTPSIHFFYVIFLFIPTYGQYCLTFQRCSVIVPMSAQENKSPSKILVCKKKVFLEDKLM